MADRVKIDPAHLSRRVKFDLPKYHYDWKGVFENWSKSWVRKNLWRVKHIVGNEEDALQECAVVFAKCQNRYEYTVDNPAWFMSLYKLAVSNQWNGLAVKDGKQRSIPNEPEADQPTDRNEGPWMVALAEASEEVQQVLVAAINAPQEFLDLLFHWDGDDIALGQRIKRLLGVSSSDVVRQLRELLE